MTSTCSRICFTVGFKKEKRKKRQQNKKGSFCDVSVRYLRGRLMFVWQTARRMFLKFTDTFQIKYQSARRDSFDLSCICITTTPTGSGP